MLERLREYKEVIALAVFFLGGYAWIESRYPKRTDMAADMAVLECLLTEYMTLTQLQIRATDLDKEIADLLTELDKQSRLASTEQLSPSLQLEINRKLERHVEDLRETEVGMRQIAERLQRNTCGRVSG